MDICQEFAKNYWNNEFSNFSVFAVRVISHEQEDGKTENLDTKIQGNNYYSKFSCDISRLFKNKIPDTGRHSSTPRSTYYEIINKRATKKQVFNLDPTDKINLWIDNRDLKCKCPELLINRKYLLMTKSYALVQYLKSQTTKRENQEYSISQTKLAGILLDRETFITEWRGAFIRRMRRFSRHFRNGKCARFNYHWVIIDSMMALYVFFDCSRFLYFFLNGTSFLFDVVYCMYLVA